MPSNRSILEHNLALAILGAADGNEEAAASAEELYHRFKGRSATKAERLAYEWAEITSGWLPGAIRFANANANLNDFPDPTEDVLLFIRERLARMTFPDGRQA